MVQRLAVSRRKPGKKVELVCDCGCGSVFYRYRNKIRYNNNYVSTQHQVAFERKKYLKEQCGSFLPLVTRYLDGAAKARYRSSNHVRALISPFFRYLCEHGIEAIDEVNCATVTAFQLWARENGFTAASKDISALSTFFQWAIVEELYKGESPVIPAIHGRRKKARSGRPYSMVEMAEMRRLLLERGNERVRAFFEIACESGMRREEICRLRLEDLTIDSRTLKVRLPNKTMRERNVFFSDRAGVRIREWLAVRKVSCDHDLIFHNKHVNALRGNSICNEFNRMLCKTYQGKVANETGFDTFSIQRLRHTLASNLASVGADANTVRTCLGWVSPASAEGYTRIDEHTRKAGFVAAMNRVERQAVDGSGVRVITAAEFLLLVGKTA